jgi:hypothetical protein
MSLTVLERAWSVYLMMHPDAQFHRKKQLDEFLRASEEINPERQLTEGLAYLMKTSKRPSATEVLQFLLQSSGAFYRNNARVVDGMIHSHRMSHPAWLL